MRPRKRRVRLHCATLALTFLSPAMRAQTYPGADWEVSTPQAEGMDPVKFANAMSSMPSTAIVIRHGKIIGTKGDITRTGYLYSGSKALLATLAAVMIERGKITFDTLVPGSDKPTAPLASMRHFLTMTSDYNLDPHSPGNHYAYSNSGAIKYGQFIIFTWFPNSSAIQVMHQTFLDKIGNQDGLSLIGDISGWGGGGFKMSTRDYARLGLLYLRNGNWNGEQLLSPEFMAGMYVPQIPPTATAGGLGTGQVDNQTGVTPRMPGTYSYGWWLPHGTNGYEGSRSRTIAITSTGSFGTSMHVLRDYDMILAGVNSVSTMAGGRIPGWLIDAFANAVVSNGPPPADTTPPSVTLTSPAPGAAVSGTITLAANASDNVGVAGVQFLVDGLAVGAQDNAAPYSVAWNTTMVANGAHTVTAQARDAAGNAATASTTVTVNNNAPAPTMSILKLVLINADTNQPVPGYDPLPDGAVLNLTTLPTRNLNIRADSSPATVGSVRFTLNGSTFRTENAAPYAMAGDTSGDYYVWTPAAGSYTLTVTPYSGSNGSGTSGMPLITHFTVVNQ